MEMTAERIEALFTRADGQFAFARWGRPIVPVIFGVEDETLRVLKGACEAVVALAGHAMAETDPELGANFMMFFCRDWAELDGVPNLEKLVPEIGDLTARLEAAGANQYRIFRFDAQGGIRACFAFVKMDRDLQAVPAETLALSQMVQMVLLWSDTAFKDSSPLAALPGGGVVLRPEIGDLIRAGYDPALPVAETHPAHALRLMARIGRAA